MRARRFEITDRQVLNDMHGTIGTRQKGRRCVRPVLGEHEEPITWISGSSSSLQSVASAAPPPSSSPLDDGPARISIACLLFDSYFDSPGFVCCGLTHGLVPGDGLIAARDGELCDRR